MKNKDNEPLKARVRQWIFVAPVMQRVRDCDIQNADAARALAFFRGAVLAALPKKSAVSLVWSAGATALVQQVANVMNGIGSGLE